MADIQSNIQVNIDTTAALANLKNLQRQLATFNTSFAKSSTAAVKAQAEFSNNLINSINATGKFAAGIQEIQSSTERFTQSLEKNKFSTREYFKYAAGSTKAFSKMFSSEFNTIQKVAEERVKDLQTQYIKMGRGANGALRAIAVRPLSLDMEDLATKVAITSQKQQIFGQLLKQGSTNLLNFGKNTQWAGRQLMVGFTIPLTIFGSKAAQVFMDLELQAIRFKRVYGEMFTTQGETTKALNEVRKLAEEFTKYGVAVVDTMKMAADAAAQGKQGADLMAQVAEATRLAVLGQVEQQQALETTMSLQNAFGYSAEQLAGKINFLNAVENQTVVGIEDLTIAIPKAGPVVKQLGGDVEDLAFFLTAMKEGGINASEGANALKSGLASLINPTEKASAMLKEMGIDIQGIVESNKGDIKGTVIGFAQALDTLAPLERARAIEQLFGKFQFARLSTLFQNVTKDGNQAARTLDLTTKSVEELAIMSERELGAVEDATGTKFKKAMEDLKVAIAPVGEQFLKAVTPIAEFVGKILEKFNGLSDGVKGGISKLVLIVGAIGPVVLMTFGLLANGLANIIKLFGAVRNGFLGLGKNSEFLGNQTNYLTTEQQEAAAIAASLDQAHSKLIQTFTLERNSIALLTEAYGQAALAASRLKVSNPGYFSAGGPRPKGYAKGIISVPGPKGAGDVVPAMLSPGEAVIPAKQNQKYGSLVEGIVADNIPGFARGLSGNYKQSIESAKDESGLYRAPSQIKPQTKSMNWATAQAEIDAMVAAATSYLQQLGFSAEQIQNKIKQLIQKQASHITEQVRQIEIAGNIVDVKEWNADNLVADLGGINNYLNSIHKVTKTLKDSDIDEMAKKLGISVEEFKQEMVDLERGIHPTKRRSGAVMGEIAKRGFSSTDKTLAYQSRAVSAAMDVRLGGDYYETLRSRKYNKEKDVKTTATTEKRVKKTEAIILNSLDLSGEISAISGKNLSALQKAYDALDIEAKKRLSKLINNTEEFTRQLLEEAKNAGIAGFKVGDTAVKEIARAAATASPSKRTRKTGEDIGAGLELGMASKVDDVARGGQRLANSAVLGVENGARGGLGKKTRTRSGAAGGLVPAERANLPRYERDGLRIVPVGTTAPNVANKKNQQQLGAERQQRRTMLARTNGVLFGMSTLSSVLGMMGNGVAAKAAPFMVAMNVATMAMQMIQGPWSALAVGAVALVGGLYMLHKKAQEQATAQSKYIDSISATSQRISEVGKITGKVGASEIMERRRQGQVSNRFTTGFNRAGQQFGTSFLESDVGKNILGSFQQSLKTNGQTAIKQLGNQLAIYVSQGLMDSEQAESIARAIGVSMSDMTITSKIVGDLRSLIGPGGTDLLKDPLEVRVNIIADSVANTKELQTAAKDLAAQRNVGLGQTQAALQGQFDPKLLAATSASYVQNLETVQQQIDSQNKMYDDQIASLRKDKEKTKDKKEQLSIENKINELIAKRKEDETVLRNQGKQILQDQINLFKEARNAGQGSTAQQAIKDQVKTRFKDNLFTDPLLEATRELGEGGKKELEVMINTVVGSGIATPKAMVDMINMFGKDTAGLEKTFTALFETQDPGKAQELITIFNSLGGREGSNKKILATIMTKISSKEGAGKFDQRLNALQLLMQMDGKEINVGAMLETEDGLAKLDAMVVDFEKIEQINTPITKKVVTDLEGTLGLEEGGLKPLISDWEEFGSLPEEIKKTAIQTYVSIYRTIGDEERSAFVQKQVAGAGSARNAEAVAATAQKASTADIAFDLYEPILKALGLDPKGGKGGKGKKGGDRKATMFDDILKKLKLVQRGSVNALGGFGELERVINAPLKKGGAYMAFDGIVNQLSRKNISADFIEMVEGLSPEELQNKFGKFLTITKNGIVKLKQDAKDLNKALAAVAAGDIVANNAKEMKKLEDRTAAVNILRSKGVDYATAMAITESNSIALAIKNGDLTTAQLTQLITSQQKRNSLEEKYKRIQETLQQDVVVGQRLANEQMLAFVELQNAIIENSYVVQKTEIEVAAKRNGYALELINYEEDLVNKVYDKQIKALDEIQQRHEQINRLQEGRISIAEALARGDMAAAARAIQSVRQQEIQAQLEAKRKGIEDARKKTLEGISVDGKTRSQIEEENAKNARNLAEINLMIFKEQLEVAKQFKTDMGVTPEQVASYNSIASAVEKIGNFNLDSSSLMKAIQDAVSGKPETLLASVKKATDETIKALFGGTVTEKALAGVGPVELNTTATSANTAALIGLSNSIAAVKTDNPPTSIQGRVADDWMFNRGLGFNFTPESSPTKSSKKKTSKKKTSGSSKISDGKAPTTQKPETARQGEKKVVTPPTGINVRNGDTTRPTTVSGSNIDISVRPSSDVVRETVAWVERQQQLAEEQKQRNIEQLAASKNAERSSANASDAVNRMSPMAAEMMGIYTSTMQLLGNNARAEAKKRDEADVQKALNEKAASDAREQQIKDKAALTVPEAIEQARQQALAEDRAVATAKIAEVNAIQARDNAIADKKSLTVPQAIAAANESGKLADRVGTAAVIAKKVADANNENRLSDIKLSNKMIEIYTGVGAQQAGLNQASYAADKKFSGISIASGINKPSIKAIEGAGVSNPTLNRDALAAEKKAESAKSTAKANITSPANLAASRATAAWMGIYRSMGGMVPKYMNMGGIVPKYFASGGYGRGTDIVPAMLTPGEFIVRKSAVDSLGIDTMQSINKGELPTSNSVYNYSLSVNVSNSNANANDIAKVVMNQIKQVDSQRIRGSR